MHLLDCIASNEYIQLLVIFIGTLIFVALSYLIMKLVVKRISGSKKSYGKFIFDQISKPVFILIFFIGLFIALESLSILLNYIEWINSFFFIVVILIAAFLISRIFNVLMSGWLIVRKGFSKPPGLINKTIMVLIYVIAIIIILAYFKVDITPMIAGLGLGALAIGLALQSTLADFFAGLHLLSDRPIEVGDFIELSEDVNGVVEDIGWRSTRISTLANNLLIIPNGKLAENNIVNFSKPKKDMSILVPCGVSYNSDLRKVENVTLEVAKVIQQTVDGAVKDFEPVFRYREFGDSNIKFIAVLRVSDPMKRFAVRHEFIKALKERFDKEKIEISWPVRKIYTMK